MRAGPIYPRLIRTALDSTIPCRFLISLRLYRRCQLTVNTKSSVFASLATGRLDLDNQERDSRLTAVVR